MSIFSFRDRARSFTHAFRGVSTLLQTQPNAWIHASLTAIVIGAGFFLAISRTDWGLLIVAIALVWIAEALNTAVEFLADEITLESRERIKQAKDVAAFAVLASAAAAVAIGVIVFLPYVIYSR